MTSRKLSFHVGEILNGFIDTILGALHFKLLGKQVNLPEKNDGCGIMDIAKRSMLIK